MRKLIYLLLLLPFITKGQTWQIQNVGVKTTINSNGSFAVDSVLRIPIRDTTKPSWWNTSRSYDGALQVGLDGKVYYYYGGVFNAIGSGGGTGTVTSISQGYGILNTPNPITTNGAIRVDTSVIPTRNLLQTRYMAYVDTAAMLVPYLRKADTASLSNRINAKQDALTLTTTGTSGAATLIGSTLNIPNYATGSGTVTSIATTNGTGITGGTITTSGTLAIDTTLIATRSWRKKGDDSLGALIGAKVNYTDTASMLTNYVRSASNGITKTGQDVALGGSLTGATTITTTGTNTLAVSGLQSGTTNDSVVVADATSGVLKRISSSRIGGGGPRWSLTGNAGTTAGTNFIGTTDAQDVVIKRNSTEVGRFASYGLKANALNIGSGTTFAGTTNNIIGDGHVVNSGAQFGTVVGGYSNTVNSTGYVYAMVGGSANTIAGTNTTVIGGASTSVAGTRCVAINGNGSYISTGATDCITIGTAYTDGVSRAIAIGTLAYAQHNGAMVLADGQQTGYLTSNTTDAFASKFLNGYRFNLAYNVNAMQIASNGNVSVGGSAPDASALFDMTSTTKGLGLPQMTTTQINAIASPKAGLTVYNTTLSTICFYNGTSWQKVTSSAM